MTACAQPSTLSPKASPEEIALEESRQADYLMQSKIKGLVHGLPANKKNPGKRLQEVTAVLAPATAELCTKLEYSDLNDCVPAVNLLSGGDHPDSFRAFSDGKTISISRGMIRFTADDNELALVLAHEMAHHMMDHFDALKQNQFVGLVIGASLEALAYQQGYADRNTDLTEASMEAGVLAYSPAFEQEADYIALYLLARSGYDYQQTPDIWRKLSLAHPDAIYLRTTHPSNAERYVVMHKAIDEIDQKKERGEPLLPNVGGK